MRVLWPWIRAALIAVVLVWHTIDALPLPVIRRSHFNHPIARDELQRWAGVLNDAGVEVSEETLKARGVALGGTLRVGRQRLLAPLQPLFRVTGTGQGWGLFAYPDPYAGRLVVEVEIDGAWQEVFRAPQRDRTLLTRQLRYRRIRGIYDDVGDKPNPGGAHNRFVDWVAADILNRRPEVDQVRVYFDQMRIRLPGEGDEPPEKRKRSRMRTRQSLEKRRARYRAP